MKNNVYRKFDLMTITFTPLTDSHLPLLLEWLKEPHVKAWWDPNVEWTLQRVQEKYGSYIQGYKLENGIKKPIQAYFFYIDRQPVGYIQLYKARDFLSKEGSLSALPSSWASFDMLIGEENFLNKGLSTPIMTQFLKEFVEPHYDVCIVNPEAANIKAIRAYEKAGFIKMESPEEGEVTWMAREKKIY